MIFMSLFVTCFSLIFNVFGHRFRVHVGILLAYIGILFACFLSTVSLLFRKSCFWRCLFNYCIILVSCWLLAPLLLPIWLSFCSFGLHLASFFLPFVARHGIVMHFRYHLFRCLLHHVPPHSAVAGPRLCRATRFIILCYIIYK